MDAVSYGNRPPDVDNLFDYDDDHDVIYMHANAILHGSRHQVIGAFVTQDIN